MIIISVTTSSLAGSVLIVAEQIESIPIRFRLTGASVIIDELVGFSVAGCCLRIVELIKYGLIIGSRMSGPLAISSLGTWPGANLAIAVDLVVKINFHQEPGGDLPQPIRLRRTQLFDGGTEQYALRIVRRPVVSHADHAIRVFVLKQAVDRDFFLIYKGKCAVRAGA